MANYIGNIFILSDIFALQMFKQLQHSRHLRVGYFVFRVQ